MAPGGYPGWIVVLDDPAVATNRTALDINNGPIVIGGSGGGNGVSWGDSLISEYIASQGRWGSTVVDYTIPNRQVTIPLALMDGPWGNMDTALAQLRQKVALFQREGGWVKRQRLGEPAMYADVVNATLTAPDVWGETGGVEPNVQLVLECLPDFYGDEIALDTIYCTGYCNAVLKQGGAQAVVQGDHPGRCRITVDQSYAGRSLAWAFRSRHYASGSTFASAIAASSLTLPTGASLTTVANSKNAQVVEKAAGGSPGVPLVNLIPSVGPQLGHVGSYRLFARAMMQTAGTELQLGWWVGGAPSTLNPPVANPYNSSFCLLDLGVIFNGALPSPLGSPLWSGVINAIGSGNVWIDYLLLQCIDESAGMAVAVNSWGGTGNLEARSEGMYYNSSATYAQAGNVYGDYPRLPPAGLEARPTELLSAAPNGTMQDTQSVLNDPTVQTFAVTVRYRPSYLFRP